MRYDDDGWEAGGVGRSSRPALSSQHFLYCLIKLAFLLIVLGVRAMCCGRYLSHIYVVVTRQSTHSPI
jgi:hypothetical protein